MANATTGQTDQVSPAGPGAAPKPKSLTDVLDEARETARDQLIAAWQIGTEFIQEHLAHGWRGHIEHVFEQRFAELAEQVKQQVQTVRDDASVQARRDVTNRLNQAVRSIRVFESEEDWSRSLVDATQEFCGRAALFSINGPALRMQAARGLATDIRIDNTPLTSAPAFANAVESRDTIVALRTRGELSAPIADLLGEAPDSRAYLFPISTRGRVAAILYADTNIDASALELLTTFAAAVLESQAAVPERAGLVGIATDPQLKASNTTWFSLTKEEQELHMRAQRFARVQVAEMRLYKPQAVKDGRANHDLYGALNADIDRVRDEFQREFLSASPAMVDYLHVELVRMLANDDVELLGKEYPGPMVS